MIPFSAYVAAAAVFWSGHNVQSPCGRDVQPVFENQSYKLTGYAWVTRPEADCKIHLSLAARFTYRHGTRKMHKQFLQTVTHEYGHLAGLEHSDDPTNIMNKNPWATSVPWTWKLICSLD